LRLSAAAVETFVALEGLPRLRDLTFAAGPADYAGLLRLHPLSRLALERSRVRGDLGRALARRHRLVLRGE
jgi:hypothetical protein